MALYTTDIIKKLKIYSGGNVSCLDENNNFIAGFDKSFFISAQEKDSNSLLVSESFGNQEDYDIIEINVNQITHFIIENTDEVFSGDRNQFMEKLYSSF